MIDPFFVFVFASKKSVEKSNNNHVKFLNLVSLTLSLINGCIFYYKHVIKVIWEHATEKSPFTLQVTLHLSG